MFGDCYAENMKVIEKEKNKFASVPFPSTIKGDKFCKIVVDTGTKVANIVVVVTRDQMLLSNGEYLYQEYYSYILNSLSKLFESEINEQVLKYRKQEK